MKSEKKDILAELEKVLELCDIEISMIDTEKERSAVRSSEGKSSVASFQKLLKDRIGASITEVPLLAKALFDSPGKFGVLLQEYAEKNSLGPKKAREITIPEEYRDLVLNVDQSHSGRDLKFFMTTPDEYVSPISGPVYLKTVGMPEDIAIEQARKVTPMYLPRHTPGVRTVMDHSGQEVKAFNTYIPPKWKQTKVKVKDQLPFLFRKLVEHLFPIPLEREYFYSWLYHSLFERAYVYLVLCGIPGSGKNRLGLVLRALHGFSNTSAGKRSTLIDRFNSQLGESTLVIFDELKYTMDMENTLKEIQNDSISIERKGIDATRSTRIFASLMISNNKPRDNYLAFDARKFAPLVVTSKRLEESLTFDQISRLTNKVENWDHPDFDVKFLKQIARWIKKNANRDLFPNLEYKGPMFWRLCHTSMSRWQKMAAALILETSEQSTGRLQFVKGKGFLWSKAEEAMSKKNIRKDSMPDYSTVKHFFEIFRDGAGNPVFKTESIKGDAMGDFYVRVVNKEAKILNEADILREMGDTDGQEESRKKKEIGNSERRKDLQEESRRKSSRTGASRRFIKVKNLAGGSRSGEASTTSIRK